MIRSPFNQKHPAASASIPFFPEYLPHLFYFPPCLSSVFPSIFSSVFTSCFSLWVSSSFRVVVLLLKIIHWTCLYHCNLFLFIIMFILTPILGAPVGQWLAHCVSISLLRAGVRVRFPRFTLVVVRLSLVL